MKEGVDRQACSKLTLGVYCPVIAYIEQMSQIVCNFSTLH